MADYTVAFSGLNALLQSLPANTVSNPYSINVTGLTTSDIQDAFITGTLGYILRNTSKFVDLSETILPNSVTSMSYSFYGCTSLTTAPNIPNSVTNMFYCFSNCTSLTTAPNIPNSVEDMIDCFSDCSSLITAPIIPNSVEYMIECFSGCTSLTTVPNIPNSVRHMYGCFYGCTSLTTAPNIPNSVTNMFYCFSNCTSLTTAPNIPNSVEDMRNCFSGCSSLITAPIIPNSVTFMNNAFRGTSITTFGTIPQNVTNLSDCFKDCINLTTIDNFQADTENCDMTNCFAGCTSLSYIGVQETAPNATKWQFVHAIEDSDGITMTIETDDTGPVEVETSEHTYGILGLICDMLFSADAFDSTRMSNYLASRMPWIVESPTSLDANEDWTVLWAKDPTKVKSNCFALKSEVGGGSSAPIGSIIASGTDLSNEGYILCDGRAVSRSDYSELFAKVGTTFGSGDGSTTFNIPDLKDKFIEGTGTNAVGTVKSAGLPNLTGDLVSNKNYSGTPYSEVSPSGVFKAKAISGVEYFLDGRRTGSGWVDISFDASRSNTDPVYGKSSTVQPPSVCLYYFIKARNISQQEVQDAIDDTKTTSSNVWSAEKVNDELDKKQNKIKTFQKNISCSFSAGTIGTRGNQYYINYSEIPNLNKIISLNIVYIQNSSQIQPLVYYQENNRQVYLNCYRATSSSVSGQTITIEIVYE